MDVPTSSAMLLFGDDNRTNRHGERTMTMDHPKESLVSEKIRIEFHASVPFRSLENAPNTFVPGTKTPGWKRHEFFSYSLEPQRIKGTMAVVDMFMKATEEDLDDIDIVQFCLEFIHKNIILPSKNLQSAVPLTSPAIAPFDDLRDAEL